MDEYEPNFEERPVARTAGIRNEEWQDANGNWKPFSDLHRDKFDNELSISVDPTRPDETTLQPPYKGSRCCALEGAQPGIPRLFMYEMLELLSDPTNRIRRRQPLHPN